MSQMAKGGGIPGMPGMPGLPGGMGGPGGGRPKKGKKAAKGKLKPGDMAIPELFIIADKSTPYRLLFGVIASARAPEAGYRRFRLIVLEQGAKGGDAK